MNYNLTRLMPRFSILPGGIVPLLAILLDYVMIFVLFSLSFNELLGDFAIGGSHHMQI